MARTHDLLAACVVATHVATAASSNDLFMVKSGLKENSLTKKIVPFQVLNTTVSQKKKHTEKLMKI